MPRGNNAGSSWIPQGADHLEAEDFVKALDRFCREKATHQERLAIHAEIAKVYADPEVAQFFDALAKISEDDEIIREDGTFEEREDYDSTNYRSTKHRMKAKLIRFLDSHYRV
jgi:hypothetical protein